MNVTDSPALMVTLDGLTALFVPIVIVAPLGPGLPLTGLGVGDGDVDVPPPHAAPSNAASPAATAILRILRVTMRLPRMVPPR
jgi:hypothetical protein